MRAAPFLCTHRILGEKALTQSARGRIHENSQAGRTAGRHTATPAHARSFRRRSDDIACTASAHRKLPVRLQVRLLWVAQLKTSAVGNTSGVDISCVTQRVTARKDGHYSLSGGTVNAGYRPHARGPPRKRV